MKKVISLILILVMFVTVITGCNQSSKSSSNDTSSETSNASSTENVEKDEQITLVFHRPGTVEVVEGIFNPMLEKYKKDNPNINIETMYFGWGDYIQKIPVMASSSTLPDVFYLSVDPGFGLAANGYLTEIEPLMDSELKEDFNSDLLEAVRYQGKIYWLPAGVGTYQLWYNTDIFERAGLDVNNPPTTWEQVREYAKTIKEKTGIPGFGAHCKGGTSDLANGWHNLYQCFAGVPMWDSSKNDFSFRDPEYKKFAVESLQFYYDLIYVDKVTQGNEVEYTRNTLRPVFRDGNVAMLMDGVWIKKDIQEQMDSGFLKATQLPAGPAPNGKSSSMVGADGWAIPLSTKYPKEAWNLLRYLVSTDQQAAHASAYGLNPVLKSEVGRPEYSKNSDFWLVAIKALDNSGGRIAHPEISSLELLLTNELQAALTQQKSVEEAIDTILSESLKAINK